jgi:hypothetical protein
MIHETADAIPPAGTVRGRLGTVFANVLPSALWITIQSRRSRNHQLRYLASQGHIELAREFMERYGETVLHGPFQGMRYPVRSALTRHIIPRLLGSYEMELHSVIAALDAGYTSVTDIGAAEGYYAVGLAMRLRVPVYAFETDGRERALLREMADLNAVGTHVIARGFCGREHFNGIGGQRSLVVSDCEGYEQVLFDADTIESLGDADLIIETHGDRIEKSLFARLRPTHRIEVYCAKRRDPRNFPELSFLDSDRAHRAVSEDRPSQSWLWCQSLRALTKLA